MTSLQELGHTHFSSITACCFSHYIATHIPLNQFTIWVIWRNGDYVIKLLRNDTYRCSEDAAAWRSNTYEQIIQTRLEHILFVPAWNIVKNKVQRVAKRFQKDFKNAARYITFTPKMNSLVKIGLNGKNEQIRGRLDFRSRFLDFRSRFWYEL